MKDWRMLLRESDQARDAVMPASDVEAMRRAVIAAAQRAERESSRPVARSLVFVGATAVTAALGVAAAWKAGPGMTPAPNGIVKARADAPATQHEAAVERQQLQFETPGGTRIIWVFDSEFDGKGTLP